MQRLGVTLLILGSVIFGPASASAESSTLVLGTATPGGGFTVYGEALAETLRETDPSLDIRTRQTAGSKENIPLLEEGLLDLGLVEGTAAYEALTGIGRTPAQLSVVAAMYSSAGMFAVRADSPYRTIADLKGQRVVFGASGSGFVLFARYVLDGLGLDLHKDFDAVLLEQVKDAPPMMSSGDAAALWGGGIGWPAFETVARDPKGARFIGLEADDVSRVQAKHPFLKTMTVAAGTYRGMDRAITTVGSWSLILARPGLPDGLAYRFARALHRAQPALSLRLGQARETTPANTLAATPRPAFLHPGVARYLKELGLIP
ncbi:MAG TPA: TAXI family TRAP transporter solute-binding subunit [Burkholderiales bacterium]|nr:TAXI family TRAP transporter solute-binding subunit [Burkholderiales bacterium]